MKDSAKAKEDSSLSRLGPPDDGVTHLAAALLLANAKLKLIEEQLLKIGEELAKKSDSEKVEQIMQLLGKKADADKVEGLSELLKGKADAEQVTVLIDTANSIAETLNNAIQKNTSKIPALESDLKGMRADVHTLHQSLSGEVDKIKLHLEVLESSVQERFEEQQRRHLILLRWVIFLSILTTMLLLLVAAGFLLRYLSM